MSASETISASSAPAIDDVSTPTIELIAVLGDLTATDLDVTDLDEAVSIVTDIHERFLVESNQFERLGARRNVGEGGEDGGGGEVQTEPSPDPTPSPPGIGLPSPIVIVVAGISHTFQTRAECTIGRHGDIKVADLRVSRLHVGLVIDPIGQQMSARDLGSGNGSWLVRDGRHHRLDDSDVPLRSGDLVVTIDDAQILAVESCPLPVETGKPVD